MDECPMEWSEDFSYSRYRAILRALSGFKSILMSKVPKVVEDRTDDQFLVMHHDIDVDPGMAMELANMEAEAGIKATFMVMLSSPLYDLEDNLGTVKQLLEMGNEVGLHFHRPSLDLKTLENDVGEDCERLEDMIGTEVKCVSFHRPVKELLHGPLLIAGRVNSYAKELMVWYISDSRGRFRVGEPVRAVSEKKGTILHLLLHPVWWAETHTPKEELVAIFHDGRTRGQDEKAKRDFSRAIHQTIDVWPKDH